jgi:Xaa-Pro aminopeptidase
MSTPPEAIEKEERIHRLLAQLGYDSLILARRDNFAWLTCGGRAVVMYTLPSSPVLLVVTPQKKYAVGYTIDLPRTMDDELGGLDYEPVALPTFSKTPEQVAVELAVGRVAADDPSLGMPVIDAAVNKLHEPYTPQEMQRYATACRESGEILRQLADWVEPGMTERRVCAHMWEMYFEQGFEGCCMFVGSDDRIRRYRHAVPSDKPIEQAVLLAPCCSKWGLHTPNSRLVYFGEPPDDIRRRFNAVATMQGSLIASIRPGVPLKSLIDLCLDLFGRLGYPEERTNHYHGGPTGYRPSYPERCQDPDELVKPNMAFAWYCTIAGAKSEEVALVDDHGATLRTVDPSWPMLDIEFQGHRVAVPDILVR